MHVSRHIAHLSPRGDDDWSYDLPKDALLPLRGILSTELMHAPDMRDKFDQRCLLVVKNGNASGPTVGRATGAHSIVREYTASGEHHTSMEWAILSLDSTADIFSKPGDSGAIIADIRGRIGGLLTGGAGAGNYKDPEPDVTYATPFWWLLGRMQANGFPNVNFDVSEFL